MSSKYPGGLISKTAPTPSGPYADSTAPGVWTLEQQAYWQKLGQWPTAGNVNPSAFIENLFSTYLYTGSGSTQTITNGIDLSGQGGMIWLKTRNVVGSNYVQDTARGATQSIYTNSTAASGTANILSSFTSSGFVDNNQFSNGDTIASWTFREQAKFFDVVTWTSTTTTNTNLRVSHNLGSVPGCIIIKATSTTDSWYVYHRTLGINQYVRLNATSAVASNTPTWGTSDPTSTDFGFNENLFVSSAPTTYVAYLFAHDAGGFGLTGTDNVISCGSFTTDGSGNATVSLGYEPQWVMVKDTTNVQNWYIEDNMRAFNLTSRAILFPNLSNAEATGTTAYLAPNSTGFAAVNGQLNASATYIYIAIRRGPMAVPTVGTSVFAPITATASTGTSRTVGFPADMTLSTVTTIIDQKLAVDRLRGYANSSSATPLMLDTTATAAEGTSSPTVYNVWNTTALDGTYSNTYPTIWWHFRRAPSFFDVVCYTGTGSATTQTHNLGVVPELLIQKRRDSSGNWNVYSVSVGATAFLSLQANTTPVTASNIWNNTAPTSSVFTVGNHASVNASGGTYVAYLFATLAGVSKVGSYTGTGAAQTINCGFTAGSRFVLIKRTDSTGDWYVWDSARGIIPSNDPYLLLNSTAAEVTGTDYVDTTSVGFDVTSTAPAAINANGGTFIFLAIA